MSSAREQTAQAGLPVAGLRPAARQKPVRMPSPAENKKRQFCTRCSLTNASGSLRWDYPYSVGEVTMTAKQRSEVQLSSSSPAVVVASPCDGPLSWTVGYTRQTENALHPPSHDIVTGELWMYTSQQHRVPYVNDVHTGVCCLCTARRKTGVAGPSHTAHSLNPNISF